jgi:[glutamine synthetase] adenylyltransferase / [glutamine synthetase]-adenylyl-L-tyrosine phosphorylase
MGKLGGDELNVGSDVDLIAFYGTADGAAVHPETQVVTELGEYFARTVRRMVWLLEDPEHGTPAFRVDLRLRPEGASGALAHAFGTAISYYESWGRTWERAALIRARPVAGDLDAGNALLGALGSFVWRRRVDLQVARDMVVLADKIQVEQKPDPWDLKLARGGIREAEFFVQTLQLVWGGRDHRLRAAKTADALRQLALRGYVTERERADLERAYVLLRSAEHRVQFATGRQTHVLPIGPIRASIAESMGFASVAELELALGIARSHVSQCFATLLPMGRSCSLNAK